MCNYTMDMNVMDVSEETMKEILEFIQTKVAPEGGHIVGGFYENPLLDEELGAELPIQEHEEGELWSSPTEPYDNNSDDEVGGDNG